MLLQARDARSATEMFRSVDEGLCRKTRIISQSKWQFPRIRGLNIDPKYKDSDYKDTHTKHP